MNIEKLLRQNAPQVREAMLDALPAPEACAFPSHSAFRRTARSPRRRTGRDRIRGVLLALLAAVCLAAGARALLRRVRAAVGRPFCSV